MTAATLTKTPSIVRTIAEVRLAVAEFRQQQGAQATVGLVPTMGFLHEGHASLIRRSATENGLTILSVFVNPLQFGPNEDFDQYPRDEARDLAVAAQAGADLVFMPAVAEMYPQASNTAITVRGVTERLCGASRPGHFDGVGVVVTKLFNIVQPDRAYFGRKDAQQVAVVARMVADLNQPVHIVPCDIVREPDGLALSSRNVYLSQEERTQALILSASLKLVPDWIKAGRSASWIREALVSAISKQPLAEVDYADVLTYPDLLPVDEHTSMAESNLPILAAVAVKFGRTRLIDNVMIQKGEAI